jgi:hypothetical protein
MTLLIAHCPAWQPGWMRTYVHQVYSKNPGRVEPVRSDFTMRVRVCTPTNQRIVRVYHSDPGVVNHY